MRAVNIHCLGTGQGAVLTPVWEEGGVLEQGWGYPGVPVTACPAWHWHLHVLEDEGKFHIADSRVVPETKE